MDPEGGQESVERLRQAGNGMGRMYIVNNAGHHCKPLFTALKASQLMPLQYISIIPRS
jgi:hypothetical protein